MLEAWLWRILVEDVFQGPGEQAWEPYAELLYKIEPLTRLTPDDNIDEGVDETLGERLMGRPENWRELMARRIKGRAMLWRCLTMNLMRIASGTSSRYTVDYVTELITRKLGRWITPSDEAGQNRLRAELQKLGEWAIKMDWHLHCNHQMFEFRFHEPTTKKAYRFPYKKSAGMELHITELDGQDKEGCPVDLVVKPSLFVWGDPSRPVEDWSFWSSNIGNMLVAVDLRL
ncbi:hypothetical protein B0I37DRAFT_375687 [Chaetomium sp. MPI-CAGE-AT-0009]|nr:hypothetical protein B0I37DRAFT_375687 [Chaetomium sp. MPI-CAGE-AT-0009]